MLNVFPYVSCNNKADEFVGDSVTPSKEGFSVVANGEVVSDPDYFSISQLVRTLPFSLGTTTLNNHINRIVFGFTQEEMVRIDTSLVIASVTDDESVGDIASVEFVRESVRGNNNSSTVGKLPVTSLIDGSLPEPASVSLQDVSPELELFAKSRSSGFIPSITLTATELDITPDKRSPTVLAPTVYHSIILN